MQTETVPRAPSVHMTFDAVPPGDRLSAIQQSLETHCVALPEGQEANDLFADVTMWPVGRAIVLRSHFRAMVWERTEAHVAADRLDHIQVHLTLSGTSDFLVAGRRIALKPGNVILIDCSCAGHGVHVDDLESITVTIPRTEFHRFAVDLSVVNGLEFTGETRALIEAHLRALVAYLPNAELEEAERVIGTTIALFAACLPQLKDTPRRISTDVTVETLRLFLVENALRPDCDVAYVQKTMGLSRSTLYRLAAPLGGISAYVTRCRLEHAASLIRSRGGQVSVARLAEACGFRSASHFSRLFSKRFGRSPDQYAKGRSLRKETVVLKTVSATEHYKNELRPVGGMPKRVR